MNKIGFLFSGVVLCIAACLSSCSVQKRVYQPGYYIQHIQNSSNQSASTHNEAIDLVNSSLNSETICFNSVVSSEMVDFKEDRLDTLKSCVTILTTDKRELKVLISDMNDLNISYRLCDNPNGPVYSIPTNQVHKFNFKNNDSDIYDLLVLKNGELIRSSISEIDESSVKYKRLDNMNGPLYTIPKTQVYLINYKNGSSDMFNSNQTSSEVEYYVKESPKEIKSEPEKSQSKGFGITSFIFGLIGMYLAFALPFGLLAVVFGSIGLNKKLNGLAIAGLILGLICIILGLMVLA